MTNYKSTALLLFCSTALFFRNFATQNGRKEIKLENIETQFDIKTELAELNNRLPVLPLRDVVIYPYMVYPVLVGRETSMRAANTSNETHKLIFLVAQKDPKIEEPKPDDLYPEGTIARIVQVLKLQNGLLKIYCRWTRSRCN